MNKSDISVGDRFWQNLVLPKSVPHKAIYTYIAVAVIPVCFIVAMYADHMCMHAWHSYKLYV